MAESERVQTDLVPVKVPLPRRVIERLDRRADRDGLRRATLLRSIILRDQREYDEAHP